MTTDIDTAGCCEEYRSAAANRRDILRGALVAGASVAFGSTVLTTHTAAFGASLSSAPSVLVVVSLRGACDGLGIVVPHGDPVYYDARPRIAIPKASLLRPDSFFGFHPSLAGLMPLWDAGRLAAVHATGLPVPNRSHFDAMEEVENANPGSAKREGWLNRLIGTQVPSDPLRGISIGPSVPPTSLLGESSYMAFRSVESIPVKGASSPRRMRSLHSLWDGSTYALARGARDALNATEDLDPVVEEPRSGADYGSSSFGQAMEAAARTIRGDVGVQVITVDSGGWDMHDSAGTLKSGRMIQNLAPLAKGIAAFFNDLGTRADTVTLVTVSEFGRRVQENAGGGTDHGYGNVMLVAGAGVRGGRYYGTWPGLQNEPDADLLVTTDYRAVLGEVVSRRFDTSLATVFPGYSPRALGVMR